MEVKLEHLQFKHPFTMTVSGPTGSGKTMLVRRILNNFRNCIKSSKNTLKVMWAYGVWQDLYLEELPNVKVLYIEGLPSEEEIFREKVDLIVIDDLMNELGNNIKLSNLFTKGSHHNNLSIMFLVQNLFHQGTKMRTISLNTHYYILLKNPRDSQQIKRLASQMLNRNSDRVMEAYKDATSKCYGYIILDFNQTTPDELRVRTRITLEELGYFSPVIYYPK